MAQSGCIPIYYAFGARDIRAGFRDDIILLQKTLIGIFMHLKRNQLNIIAVHYRQ